jgi:hypothetical protein
MDVDEEKKSRKKGDLYIQLSPRHEPAIRCLVRILDSAIAMPETHRSGRYGLAARQLRDIL